MRQTRGIHFFSHILPLNPDVCVFQLDEKFHVFFYRKKTRTIFCTIHEPRQKKDLLTLHEMLLV